MFKMNGDFPKGRGNCLKNRKGTKGSFGNCMYDCAVRIRVNPYMFILSRK